MSSCRRPIDPGCGPSALPHGQPSPNTTRIVRDRCLIEKAEALLEGERWKWVWEEVDFARRAVVKDAKGAERSEEVRTIGGEQTPSTDFNQLQRFLLPHNKVRFVKNGAAPVTPADQEEGIERNKRIYSREFRLGEYEDGSGFVHEMGVLRVFAMAPGTVLAGYEKHKNSIQRIKVVGGRGTWHVASGRDQVDECWESPCTVAWVVGQREPCGKLEFPSDQSSDQAAFLRTWHVVDENVVHFVENPSTDEPMVCLTFHGSGVEDDFVLWSDLELGEGGIAPGPKKRKYYHESQPYCVLHSSFDIKKVLHSPCGR